jgi:TonB family protein
MISAKTAAPSRVGEAPQAATAASQYPAAQSGAAAAIPATVPGPDPTANYQAMISAWFESHKHYPESARQHGEEGGVKLRFRVDRFGRVLGYRLLESTGYPDLDAGIDQMMRGAQLPPFPAGMMPIPDRGLAETAVQPDAMMPIWYQSGVSECSNDRQSRLCRLWRRPARSATAGRGELRPMAGRGWER